MNSSLPPDLPSDLRALFASERAAPDPSADVQARVLAGVQAAVVAGAGAGAVAWWMTRGAWLKGFVGVALGVSVVVAGSSVFSHRPHGTTPSTPRRIARVTQPAPRAPAAPTLQPVIAPPVVVVAPSIAETHRAVAASAAHGHDATLALENTLMSQAHEAIRARDGRAAMAALHAYARQVHGGQLVEESEVVWIQALALEGDVAGARARAQRFLRTHPDSPNAPGVEHLAADLP